MGSKDEEAMRPCLGHECQKTGKQFLSRGFGNRFCPECDKKRKTLSTTRMISTSDDGRISPKSPTN